MARSPFSLHIAHEAQATHAPLVTQRMLVLSCALLLVGLSAGALLSLRWQDRAAANQQSIARQGDTALVAVTTKRLEQEQADLRSQITDLRGQMSSLQSAQAANKSQLSEVTDEITRDQIAAGLVPLAGQGLTIHLDDSTDSVMQPNEDPVNYILHDYDLRDVINTLWGAGAEAISVNNQRIVSTSSLYCIGTTIVVNVTRLSPPYTVSAIGNSDTLEAALHSSSLMTNLSQRSIIYDLPFQISKEASVNVPAYTGSIGFRYANQDDGSDTQLTATPTK